ncbi:MAG TPA: acyltransferase [Candidatus Binatia bacterium]|nr:acyltransferase [Candidatus Binatia bacterium]
MSLTVAAGQQDKSRVPGIDVLRGLCIVAVVLHHINLRIHFRDSSLGQLLGPAANRALFWNGYYGVRMFFVISGFLITSWSLKRWGGLSQLNVRQFYWMRFARIMPCLAGLLLALALLDRLGVPRFVINTQHTSLVRALIAALTFHANWLEAKTGYLPASWDVLWSLSVEEIFYIVFPLLCALLRKKALLIGVLTCFGLVGPFARVHTQNALWADYGYLACMDGIAFGCLAAMVAAKIKLRIKANLAFRICGALLCLLITVFRGVAVRLAFYKAGLDVTVLEIGSALLLIALQQNSERRVDNSSDKPTAASGLIRIGESLHRSTGFLRWFGRNSYEVYLTHMFAIWPMVGLFFYFHQTIHLAPLWFLATLALTGVMGYLVARFYSEPLNQQLRRRLRATPKRSVVAAD